jgi:hypothetical protein
MFRRLLAGLETDKITNYGVLFLAMYLYMFIFAMFVCFLFGLAFVWARLPMQFRDEPCCLFLAALFGLRIAECFIAGLKTDKMNNSGVLFLAMYLYMFIVALFVCFLFGLACQRGFTTSRVVCLLLHCFVCVLLNVSSASCWPKDRSDDKL